MPCALEKTKPLKLASSDAQDYQKTPNNYYHNQQNTSESS